MSRLLFRASLLIVAVALFSCRAKAAWEFTIDNKPTSVVVNLNGKLFTEYVTDQGNKPYLWPIAGPNNEKMTRGYPMEILKGEEHDHPHHRSLWFTHGRVNGVSFWEEKNVKKQEPGHIKHRKFVEVNGGPTAKIVTLNDWITPKGEKILEDKRTFVFRADDGIRIIDAEIVLKPTNGPVTFGDTKEGAFGMRVAESMRVALPKEQKGKLPGHILTSEGLTDKAAWGKPAAWVDYQGMVNYKPVGITIMNHPTSFRYPTPWHVRDYGLFAANPFGLHDFDAKHEKGDYVLKPGETLTLRYRVLLHNGDEKQGKVDEIWDDYKKLYPATESAK